MARRAQILIVEDNRPFAENLAEILATRGFEGDVVTTAEEALVRFGDHSYDGMVADIRLPGVSGIELLETLRKHGSELPVIVVTAFASADAVQSAQRLGALDVLDKPVNVARLLELLEGCSVQTH